MRFLLMVLCITIYALIVLDATPCSQEQMRAMILDACAGNYRTRRGFSKTESPKHNEVLYGSRVRHRKKYKIIANDASGGLLVRQKRESIESYMYCCQDVTNCTEIFSC